MRGLAHEHAAKRVTGTCTADFCELANRARETTDRKRQRGRGGYSDERQAVLRHRMSRCGGAAATGAAWRGTNLQNAHQEWDKN